MNLKENSTNATQATDEFTSDDTSITTLDICMMVFFAFISICVVTLNVLLLSAFFRKIKKKTFSNLLYVSNSFIDLLNGCIVKSLVKNMPKSNVKYYVFFFNSPYHWRSFAVLENRTPESLYATYLE